MGNITVELYNETPKHRDNFIKLAKEGVYDSTLFHRVIKQFMVQAGDPTSKTASDTAMLGNGDVGYTIPAEFVPKFFHHKGVLAAAREGDNVNPQKASSGCQFYIVTGRKFTEPQLLGMENKINEQREEAIFDSSNQSGDITDKEISMQLTISAPWYATWWAFLLYIISFIGCLYYFISSRIAKRTLALSLEKERFEKQQTATD